MKPRDKIDWAAAAEIMALIIPRSRLESRVVAMADAMSKRAAWAVGFSGGPDSLALLLLLWAHWAERRGQIVAFHFNHRLRGRESDGDEKFCGRVCRALGIKLRSALWRGDHRGASEAEAREARLAFLAKEARVIWLGHQQDDIAESMLMRLARGSGTAGLAAPRPVQVMGNGRIHLRPMLPVKKKEIIAALRKAGAEWRDDSSNATGTFFRNRVRSRVIPAWVKAAGRDALAGAALARSLLEEDDSALQGWLEDLSLDADRGGLNLEALVGKPRALHRRALHRWLMRWAPGVELSRQGFEALLEASIRGEPTRQSLGRAAFAVIRRGVLRLEKIGKRPRRFNRRPN